MPISSTSFKPKYGPDTAALITKMRLMDPPMSFPRIAEALGIPLSSCIGVYKRDKNLCEVSNETYLAVSAMLASGVSHAEIGEKLALSLRTVGMVEKIWKTELQEMVDKKDPLINEETIYEDRCHIANRWKDGRYLVVADQHHPFQNQGSIEDMFCHPSVKNSPIDGCLNLGDCLDMPQFATFRQHHYVSHETQIKSSKEYHKRIIKKCDREIYIGGANHEARLMKRLVESKKFMPSLPKGAEKIVFECLEDIEEWYTGTSSCDGVKVHKGWWVQIGNLVVGHMDRSSSRPGMTAENFVKYFMQRRPNTQTRPMEWVIDAHTHQHSFGYYFGVGAWTCPAQTRRQDWMSDSKAFHGHLHNGWGIVVMRKGKLVFNESRFYISNITDPWR